MHRSATQGDQLDSLEGKQKFPSGPRPPLTLLAPAESKTTRMELLVCVINEEDRLNDILSGFVELGVTGATVLNSHGMARHLPEAPVFAGLKDLMSGARPQNTTVFSVIESKEKLDAAIAMIQNVCGDLSAPGTGILFTLSLNQVIGMSSRLVSGSD